jgi:flagellar hook-basal body complex protein FliE
MQINPNILSTIAYQKIDRTPKSRVLDILGERSFIDTENQMESVLDFRGKVSANNSVLKNTTNSISYNNDKSTNTNQIFPGQILDRKPAKLNTQVKDNIKSFDSTLKEFISDVNNLQNQAGDAMNKMATGEATDIHEVMVAVEKAKTSFELLMELRNKTVDAYRELIRMQV